VIACAAGVLVAALPRAGWLALTAFMATCLATHSHAGGALLLVAAALVPVSLSPRDGPAWPLAVGAPALGAIGLAGAWPAIAGLAGPLWRRAMLAATGWLWLALARAPYASSTSDTVHQVLSPLVTVGTLGGAAGWAGRSPRSCFHGRESGARPCSRRRCWRGGRRGSRWPRSRPRTPRRRAND
jgi:hypothetical protein